MIRRADVDDAVAIASLGKRFSVSVGMGDRYSASYAVMSAKALLGHHEGAAWLWEPQGRPVGVIAAQLVRCAMFPEVIAQERMWWIDVEHRGRGAVALRDAFVTWARDMGADRVRMSTMEPRAGALLHRAGFARLPEIAWELMP